MKVVHVNSHLAWAGGIEVYLLSLLPRLDELGHEQVLVYGTGEPGLWHRSHHVPLVNRAGRAARRAGHDSMRKLLADEAPDLVHVHNIHNTGVLEACLESVPSVLTAHDYRFICPASTFYFRRSRGICQRVCGPGCFTTTLIKKCMTLRPSYVFKHYDRVRWFLRTLGRWAHVIAPSESARVRFLQVGMPASRVTTIPYFCPVKPLAEPPPQSQNPTVLFVGRIRENKGYGDFIRALGLLPKSISGMLVGDLTPRRAEAIRRLAAGAGCPNRLEVRPWAAREEIDAIYRKASVFVFPSVWAETLGIVGLEALACGVPVVASDVGGVREWLKDGATGLLVPPKDPQAIADAVLRILESNGRARGMGRAGIALIGERFSPDEHVQTLIDLYQSASQTERLRVSAKPGATRRTPAMQ